MALGRTVLSLGLSLWTLFSVGCGTTYMTKGSWEAEGSFELSDDGRGDSDFDSNVFAAEGFLGAAATDNLQLGPALSYRSVDRELGDGSDVESDEFLLAWRFRWNFVHEGPVSPFAEADIGVGRAELDAGDGSNDSTDLLWGAALGTRLTFSDSGAVVIKGQYLAVDWDREAGGDLDRFALLAGLSIRF